MIASVTTEEKLRHLEKNGHVLIEFQDKGPLIEIQDLMKAEFPCDPEEWHRKDVNQEDHLKLVKEINDKVYQQDLVRKLVQANLGFFEAALGPDIDIQTSPHLRISRPDLESDFVNWHRDTFYGNSPWEINLWFPVFPLRAGAGLLLMEGSHVVPSRNVREAVETDPFRKRVKRGSVAHDLGYVYLPKTDDTLAQNDFEKATLLRPEFGSAVFFFGCGLHRAINHSSHTRVTLDIRLRNTHTPTTTKVGYYQPLCRGAMSRCISRFTAD